jgi:hypothetical protein
VAVGAGPILTIDLGYLGVAIDKRHLDAGARLSERTDRDADVSAANAAVRTPVIRPREDLQIADGVEQVLGVSAAAALT